MFKIFSPLEFILRTVFLLFTALMPAMWLLLGSVGLFGNLF